MDKYKRAATKWGPIACMGVVASVVLVRLVRELQSRRKETKTTDEEIPTVPTPWFGWGFHLYRNGIQAFDELHGVEMSQKYGSIFRAVMISLPFFRITQVLISDLSLTEEYKKLDRGEGNFISQSLFASALIPNSFVGNPNHKLYMKRRKVFVDAIKTLRSSSIAASGIRAMDAVFGDVAQFTGRDVDFETVWCSSKGKICSDFGRRT